MGEFGVMNSQQLYDYQQTFFDPAIFQRDRPSTLLSQNTDWGNLAFQTGLTQNYTLSVSGGSDKTQVYVSGNYYNEDGTLRTTGAKAYNLRTNISHNISEKLKLGVRLDAGFRKYQDDASGNYGALVGATRNLPWDSEYPGDNVALSGTTTDPLYNVYNYTDFPGNNVTTSFWRQAYKVIFSANQIIEKINDGESPTLDQLKGENLYLRAMAHFNLVRFFGRPYAQGNGNNPGIVIQNSTNAELLPGRSTVKEVYNFIIADLQKAAGLMTVPKDSRFASKEVANALLARLYLYMEDNAKAIEHANLVINSNRYRLLSSAAYKTYFRAVPENNSETIFAIRHTQADNRLKSAIGSMYYNDPVSQSTG